jgi:hypothetical protein
MKNPFTLLLSFCLFLFACSQSDKPIPNKQAIIKAYKDSITLDSLRRSKINSVAPAKKVSKITSEQRRYTDNDYNMALAIVGVYDALYADNEKYVISNIPDHLQNFYDQSKVLLHSHAFKKNKYNKEYYLGYFEDFKTKIYYAAGYLETDSVVAH